MTATESRIKKRHEFIAELAAQSTAIAAMALNKCITEAPLGSDAFNLANCAAHRRLIVRAIEELISIGFSSIDNVRNLLANVIRGNTNGAFAELAGYEWIMRCHVRFQTHTLLTASDVLGTGGSTLDGRIEHGAYILRSKRLAFMAIWPIV